MSEELKPKIKRFCREYLIDNNATQAAIRAGYSKKTAKQQGSRLLTNVDIQEYIKQLQEPVIKKYKITAEKVLQGIADLAFNGRSDSSRAAGLKMLGEHYKLFTHLHESTMEFKQMGSVKMKEKAGGTKEISFDVGKPITKKD